MTASIIDRYLDDIEVGTIEPDLTQPERLDLMSLLCFVGDEEAAGKSITRALERTLLLGYPVPVCNAARRVVTTAIREARA